jgi:hypothetical protein
VISGDDCELAVDESELVSLFITLNCSQLVTGRRINIIPAFLPPLELLVILLMTLALSALLFDFMDFGAEFDGSGIHHYI